jgi:hypothetical protein
MDRVRKIARRVPGMVVPMENQIKKVIHTVLDKVAVEPTERSIPLTVKAKVIPVATIVTIQTARIMVIILERDLKNGMDTEKTIRRITIVSRTPHLAIKSITNAFVSRPGAFTLILVTSG